MIARVRILAAYLNETTSCAQQLHILHCSRYFHSIVEHAFSLAFELPDPTPTTLRAIISNTRGTLDPPHLGDRYFLASSLAPTLYDPHTTAFYHPKIPSYNTIFISTESISNFRFPASTTPAPPSLKLPPISQNAYRYRYPTYMIEAMRHGKCFRLEYDHYGIDLVLLEIGFGSLSLQPN